MKQKLTRKFSKWLRKNWTVVLATVLSFLALSALPVEARPGEVDKTGVFYGTKPVDWFDLKTHQETLIWIIATFMLIGTFLAAMITVYRTSHAKGEIIKKVEDEANEIKSFNASVVTRLLEAISDQQKKDLFQTIAQGQAALWKEKET